HWAQRAYAETRADRTRIEALQMATQTLAGPIDPADAVPAFLDVVRTCFEAGAADLVFLTCPDDVHHSGEPGTETVSREIAVQVAARVVQPRGAERAAVGDGSVVAGLLQASGHANCLIATLL